MPSRLAFLLALAVLACGREGPPNPVKEAFARAPQSANLGAAVAFQFPATRGRDTRVYRLPGFVQVDWRFEATRRPIRSIVGFAADQDLVYALTDADELAALDLATGRVRVVDTLVAVAALSPTGTPVLVHRDGTVAAVINRSPVPWGVTFSTVPSRVWVAARDRLVATVPQESGRLLQQVGAGQATISQPMPPGEVTVADWADAVAVSTDSALVLLDPADPHGRRSLAMTPAPRFAAFSPSGHRLYVVDGEGGLRSIDRFTLEEVRRLQLPGAAAAARMDPWGRDLLVRPAVGDSIWIVDVISWQLEHTVAGGWDEALPSAAPDGSVLVRRGNRVVCLSGDTLADAGATEDSRGDLWLAGAWDPRKPALEAVAEGGPEAQPAGQMIYVQVSSTSNPDWAADLAANLRRAGMQASVLPPDRPDEPYRVVLGPYATREEAESTGRRLSMPYWIFTRDTSQTP